MSTAIPLIVAFLGAGLGAYFAFLKTRKERLWLDRYEALRNVVLNLETIQTQFEMRAMHESGVMVCTTEESERLETEWPNSRQRLRESLAMLRLLFKDNQIKKLIELQFELNQAFLIMFSCPPHEPSKTFDEIAEYAKQAIDEAIKVAQKSCI